MKRSPMKPRKTPLRQVKTLEQGTGRVPARRPVRDTGPSAKVRHLVHVRDGWLCAGCGVNVRGIVHSVQHRSARGMGGTSRPEANSPVNLILLCGDGVTGCHGRATRMDPEMHARGLWLRSWEDPAAVPVAYATPDGYARFWLAPDGGRSAEHPEGAAA